MKSGADYMEEAGRVLEDAYDKPVGLDDFIDDVVSDNPEYSHVAQSAQYLLDAIESKGTRTVVEEGEEKTRYRFFDDPENEGEHAVLGNTDVLNDWVDSLRSKAAERGDKNQEMSWFVGPTATGKSELKRCLINGLNVYSKTDEGRRYTLQWNITPVKDGGSGISYGGEKTRSDRDEYWFDSPVQTNPLAAYPQEVRDDILDDLNESREAGSDVLLHEDLDPFSQAAYDDLFSRYRNNELEGQELIDAILSEDHVQVKNYVMDIDSGIGVLHAEDGGQPKEKLVGKWIPQRLAQFEKTQGKKDPRAYSYEGILSQGNKGLTIIEDAIKHTDVLFDLLNVADESKVKLDIGIPMDIDTQLLVISNPDLEKKLNQSEDAKAEDPMRALRRRMDKYRLKYLTNYSLEQDLIRRGVTNDTEVQEHDAYDEIVEDMRAPLYLSVETDEGVYERELAPHTLESAAMYNVITRLTSDLPEPSDDAVEKYDLDDDYTDELSLIDKAVLFDSGELERGDIKLQKKDFEWNDEAQEEEGKNGIAVTYTTGVLADMLLDDIDRRHPHVIMPQDVLREMTLGLSDSAVFGDKEADKYADLVEEVVDHVYEQQQEDVIDAIMHNKRADTETIVKYVKHAQAWVDDSQIVDGSTHVDPDQHLMRDFEVEHLGAFDEDAYKQNDAPKDKKEDAIRTFRTQNITNKITDVAENARKNNEAFDIEEYAAEIPVIKRLLESNSWTDVERLYEDFEPRKWRNPPNGTETAELKDETIQNMVELFDYTEESAEITSWAVIAHDNGFDDDWFEEEKWL